MMRRLRGLSTTALVTMLIPISAVPIALGVPVVVHSYDMYRESVEYRDALDPPDVKLSTEQARGWHPLPAYDNAVPVLAYHGINNRGGHYTVTQKQFAEQMAMLHNAGFHAISISQYAAFLRGVKRVLPIRPILITFDDGRLDSWKGADKVLKKHKFRAVMFASTGLTKNRYYLSMDELSGLQNSGHWDVQLQAGDGHTNIPSGPRGAMGPAYTNLRYYPNRRGQIESMNRFRLRVSSDILSARRLMYEHFPKYHPIAIAPPFGSWGQRSSNDKHIAPWMKSWLLKGFASIMDVSDPVYSKPHDTLIHRYEVHSSTSTGQMWKWLRHGLSFDAWTWGEKDAARQLGVRTKRQPRLERLIDSRRKAANPGRRTGL